MDEPARLLVRGDQVDKHGKPSDGVDRRSALLRQVSRELRAGREHARRTSVQDSRDYGMPAGAEGPRNFLCVIPISVVDEGRLLRCEGKPLRQISGTGFRRRGVRHGDTIYVAAYPDETGLLLLGKGCVSEYLGAENVGVWPAGRGRAAREHIDCSGGTKIRLSRVVPETIAGQLLVVDLDGRRVLLTAVTKAGRDGLDGVLELSPDSALELDAVLRKGGLKRR
jgi:hypothetical protein